MFVSASNVFCLTLPLSMTNTTSGTVMDVSATLVARMIFLLREGRKALRRSWLATWEWRTSTWVSWSLAPARPTSSLTAAMSSYPGRNTSTAPSPCVPWMWSSRCSTSSASTRSVSTVEL